MSAPVLFGRTPQLLLNAGRTGMSATFVAFEKELLGTVQAIKAQSPAVENDLQQNRANKSGSRMRFSGVK